MLAKPCQGDTVFFSFSFRLCLYQFASVSICTFNSVSVCVCISIDLTIGANLCMHCTAEYLIKYAMLV